MDQKKDKLLLALSMIIFGTIGLVRRSIPLSSALLACLRGIIGVVFLLLFMLLTGKKLSRGAIKKNALLLVLSGALIGFNWILLFEAYNMTSVAVATLCYYMEPVFVILASPFLLKERLTGRRLLCTAAALFGMCLVSGVIGGQNSAGPQNTKGIIFGLAAAALYSTVVLMNKFIKDISAYDKTVIQLAAAGIVLIPYILLTETVDFSAFTGSVIIMVLIAGIVHTGICYALYFGAMGSIPVQTVAIMSYIDPVVALLLSVFVLKEPFGTAQLIGAALILGATFISDRN